MIEYGYLLEKEEEMEKVEALYKAEIPKPEMLGYEPTKIEGEEM